jgi:hypothetical protein
MLHRATCGDVHVSLSPPYPFQHSQALCAATAEHLNRHRKELLRQGRQLLASQEPRAQGAAARDYDGADVSENAAALLDRLLAGFLAEYSISKPVLGA